ncbi:MAG: phosphoglucosamine mutase [Candidatus Omnitrophica bacterium]|nr:phosphoglucosamine mutase [Candidatus Omnitrophota bacterium]
MKNKIDLFGTDGIRGTPGMYPLTDEMLSRIARACARAVMPKKTGARRVRIVIGKDTRLSGKQIEEVLAENIMAEGADVFLAGTITTPGLSFLTKNLKADCGIMISASHNKASDNGLKFFGCRGAKFSVRQERKIEKMVSSGVSTFVRKAKGRQFKVRDSQAKYSRFLTSTVKGLDLKGIKIALDCAWGAACGFAPRIFRSLGATVYSIHDKPCGHNINIGGALDPQLLKKLVLDTKSDIGIAVDGDGDRGILIDEAGRILDGDCVIAIMARHMIKNKNLRKNTVVGTLMSNLGLKTSLNGIGVKMIIANVGDKYVLESLLANKLNLGGEQSGHTIFLDYSPTPDGLLTALQLLQVMLKDKAKLSQLASCMTKYPQVLVNIKVREKRPFEDIPALKASLKASNSRLGGQGRILLRYSGTELLARVMVEGKDQGLIEQIAGSLAGLIRQAIGA